ncbi:MAG: ribosome biogenesis GTPase Der [Planctomycetes bacterium]|nr:ribosome biogenesis GTPase Der [Planctomycetota bacterium]
MKLPVVVIVGRPNVGKSSLLNCLAGERISIVEETPGVTRDRVSAIVFHQDAAMELVDTGGIGIVDRDDLVQHVNRQIWLALALADVILFVVDAREGLTPLDREVAHKLRESPELQDRKRPILLIANKVDAPKHENAAAEFFALGLGEPIPMSAKEGFGRTDLLDRIVQLLPPAGEVDLDPTMRIAVVGRQNVGKSTFVNALAREERVIVSEIPGTTRDAIDVRIEKDGRIFILIDTAGLTRRGRHRGSIEFYSHARAEAAIRRADVVLLMIDALEEVSKVDKKIADLIEERGKPSVVLINKWDLSQQQVETERYARYLDDRLPGLSYAPKVFITAKGGRNVQSAIDIAQQLFKKSRRRIPTAAINRLVEKIKEHHGPARLHGKGPKIFYVAQVGAGPPTFVLFVNDPELFPKDYRRYIENRFREALDFGEIPLRLLFRQRESIYHGKELK